MISKTSITSKPSLPLNRGLINSKGDLSKGGLSANLNNDLNSVTQYTAVGVKTGERKITSNGQPVHLVT